MCHTYIQYFFFAVNCLKLEEKDNMLNLKI